MMNPSTPAATSVSADAVTCSEMCPWSTYMMFTSRALAAASSIRFTWLPRVSVLLQIETPINGFLTAAAFSPLPPANRSEETKITEKRTNNTFFIFTILLLISHQIFLVVIVTTMKRYYAAATHVFQCACSLTHSLLSTTILICQGLFCYNSRQDVR